MPYDPDISIVIPCYNVAETLPATIASIRSQTHVNWEAVCVDDESGDRTRELLASFAREDARIRWIFARHGGLAKTRNRGLRETRAPHVLFLDADDILRPDALATLLRVSREDPGAIVAGGYELLDSDAQPLGVYRFPSVPEFSVDALLAANRFSVTTLVPKTLLGDRPFDEEMVTACEDWNLWLTLAHRGAKCLTAHRVIFGYRLRAGSLGHTSDLAYASGRQTLERWLPFANDSDAVRDVLHRWAANCGARAFVAGSQDAISRYFEDLPPLEPTAEFPGAVASSIRAAYEFVQGSTGTVVGADRCRAENAAPQGETAREPALQGRAADFSPRGARCAKIRRWLRAGPLSEHTDAILAALGATTPESRDFAATARRFLDRRPDARRVLIYGLGTNGATLLEEIRRDDNLANRELCVADDRASALTFDLCGLEREDPRAWNTWPKGTVAIVTPNECEAICATLVRSGGRPGMDFMVLADDTLADDPADSASVPEQPRVLRLEVDAGPRGLTHSAPRNETVARGVARRECLHPDVSVIVACHNAADTVAETIASVQAQTHANWELICIDDESSDRTPEILASLSDGDERVCWERVPHRGQSATKNRGVPLARGQYVLFLDSDDILRPAALDTLLHAARATDDRSIIAGGYELLDSVGQPLSVFRFPTVREFSVDKFLRSNRISVVSLVPRHMLGDTPFDESLETCIDWDLWLRMAHSGARCVTVPRVIFGYRLHARSLSRRIDIVHWSGRRVLERWLPRAGDPLAVRDVLHRWAAAQGALALAAGSPGSVERYFADLPPLTANIMSPDFCPAVANSLDHAFQFVGGATGRVRLEECAPGLATIEAWLRSGPLTTWADEIIAHFGRLSTNARDPLEQTREFLSHHPDTNRVVIYGLGTNGVTLVEQLRDDPISRSCELLGADDHADRLTFDLLGLPRNNPRHWRQWPDSTIAIVTPNDFAAMRTVLRAAGGREGADFLILACDSSPSNRWRQQAEVVA